MSIIFPILISVLAVILRIAPHPANFVPMGALAMVLFSVMPRRQGMLFLLGAMLVSDAVIGFYDWKLMLAVYGSLILMGLIAHKLISGFSLQRILMASLVGAMSFFLITNFTVWLFGNMYANNLTGLLESYAMAIPFFRNSLLADFFWGTIFFGAYERIRKRQMSPPVALNLTPSFVAVAKSN